MPWTRPDILKDGDTLVVACTKPADYRVPFTFAEALNDGVLFDRPARVFKDAAHGHHLFEITNTRSEALVATCILQEMPDPDGRAFDVGGLLVHPGARHTGLIRLLVRVALVREFLSRPETAAGTRFFAFVVDGNAAPIDSLVECGFAPDQRVLIRADEVGADIDHMIEPGSEGLWMQRYVFDHANLGRVARDLHDFLLRDDATLRSAGGTVSVDLSAVLETDALDRFLRGLSEGDR